MIDIFTDEKKIVISQASNRTTDFDEVTNIYSVAVLSIFIAKEYGKKSYMLFETKEKETVSVEKIVFFRYYKKPCQD